jgi:LPS sulfotransferase NodH
MRMVIDKQFVFIVGAARSGTTWLQAMLGAHPAVCTFGELQLYDYYTAPWVKAWKRQQEVSRFNGLPTIWNEEQLYEILREFLKRIYSRVLETKPEASIVLDKHPGYSAHVEHINRLIPNAKFIHMIRDGRDVAVSLRAASQGWGRLWAPAVIESAASLWKSSVIEARKARDYGGRYMEVRYEELLSEGIQVLKSVFEFLSVPIDLEDLTSIFNEHQFERMKEEKKGTNQLIWPDGFFRKGQAGDWQNALKPMKRYVFHEIAGDLLCELGYANNSWWADQAYQRFLLPPIVMLSSRRRIKVTVSESIKRLLGPTWTDRVRNVRTHLKRDEVRGLSGGRI